MYIEVYVPRALSGGRSPLGRYRVYHKAKQVTVVTAVVERFCVKSGRKTVFERLIYDGPQKQRVKRAAEAQLAAGPQKLAS